MFRRGSRRINRRRPRRIFKKKATRKLRSLIKKVALSTTVEKLYVETKLGKNNPGTIFVNIPNYWLEWNFPVPELAGRTYLITGVTVSGLFAGGTSSFFSSDSYNQCRFILALWKPRSDHLHTPLTSQVLSPTIDDVIAVDNSKVEGMMHKYIDKRIIVKGTPLIASTDAITYDTNVRNVSFSHFFKTPIRVNMEGGSNELSYPDKELTLSMISDSGFAPHPGFINGNMRFYYQNI